VLRGALGAATLTLVYVLALTRVSARQSAAAWLWWFGAATAALLAALVIYLFTHSDVRLDASGLRILWQLAKATGASVVLGAGCWAVFGKRAGIVLLHGGLGLLMFSELYTATQVVEAQMSIAEGDTAYWAQDIRSVELAFTDVSRSDVDRQTVVPGTVLIEALASGRVIEHPDLPVGIRVVEHLRNAQTRWLQPGETSAATAGYGQVRTVEELPPATGVETEQSVDAPAMYVEILPKGGGASQGVYLTTPLLNGEALDIDGKPWEMTLRFKRIPKPYSVELVDFKFEKYVGTGTAKNYESVVQFRDPPNNW
jgi:hypothetical protein